MSGSCTLTLKKYSLSCSHFASPPLPAWWSSPRRGWAWPGTIRSTPPTPLRCTTWQTKVKKKNIYIYIYIYVYVYITTSCLRLMFLFHLSLSHSFSPSLQPRTLVRLKTVTLIPSQRWMPLLNWSFLPPVQGTALWGYGLRTTILSGM